MLRVTIKKQESVEIWELEGTLSGVWVSELDRLWKTRTPQAGVTTEIHLKAVSYIDPAGKQVLTEMHAHGAEIKGCGCMTRAVVEAIVQEKEARNTNGLPKKILAVILLTGSLLGGSATLCAQQGQPRELMVRSRVTVDGYGKTFAGRVDSIAGAADAFAHIRFQFGNQFHNGHRGASLSSFGVCIPICADDVLNEEGAAA